MKPVSTTTATGTIALGTALQCARTEQYDAHRRQHARRSFTGSRRRNTGFGKGDPPIVRIRTRTHTTIRATASSEIRAGRLAVDRKDKE